MAAEVVKRLLRTTRPQPDESPVGFILRLTELNGYETPSWILRLTGLDKDAFHNFQFMFGDQWAVELLSRASGVSCPELSGLKYIAASKENQVYRYEVFGSPIPRYFIRPKHPKICPVCLREYGYCRKVWELAPVTVCPIHRCLLTDECPNCKKRISWVRKEVSICPCLYDWRGMSPKTVSGPELSVTRGVWRACNLTAGEATESQEIDANPLDALSLEHFLSALFFVAAQHDGVIDTKGKFTVKGRRNLDLHTFLVGAATVFEQWPKNFEEFLEQRRRRFPVRQESGTGLYKDFGTLYQGLYFNLSSGCFDFMRRAFEDYVGRRWNGGYAGTIRRRKGAVLTERKYISKTEARNRLKIDASNIERLVEAGRLNALVRERGRRRMFLVELASVERLELEFQELLTTEEVAGLLNVGHSVVPELVRRKFLRPARGPEVDGLPYWKFPPNAVEEFLDKLETCLSGTKQQSVSETVDFSTALRMLSRRGYGTGIFLQDMLDGRVSPCGKVDGKGVKRFLFAKEDVRNLRKPIDGENGCGRIDISASKLSSGASASAVFI